jgi:hypothetical protein
MMSLGQMCLVLFNPASLERKQFLTVVVTLARYGEAEKPVETELWSCMKSVLRRSGMRKWLTDTSKTAATRKTDAG